MLRVARETLLGLVGVTVLLGASQGVADDTLPAWAIEEMDRTEGRWIADNSAYESAAEPYDAYGMEWQFAPGDQSLIGRLFAIDDGKELGTLWEYRLIWHPERKALWLIQFATDGTFGEGAVESTGSQSTQMTQTFFARGGASWQAGHRATHQGDRRSTQSFSIDPEGTWKLLRTYVWVKNDEPHPLTGDSGIDYEPEVLFQLAVGDLGRAIDFYTKVLGFELEMRSDELEWARIKPGVPGVTIGLGRQEVVEGSATVSLNLAVQDLDAARSTLEERGVRFEGPTVEVPGVVRLADFEDPDGNRIRLAEDIASRAGG